MAKKKGRKRQQKKLDRQANAPALEGVATGDDADGDDEGDEEEPAPPTTTATANATTTPAAESPPVVAATPPDATTPPTAPPVATTERSPAVIADAPSPSKEIAKEEPAKDATAPAPALASIEDPGYRPAKLVDYLKEQFDFTNAYAWLLIAVVVFAAYANSLWVPFIFDDAPVITRNRNFRALSTQNVKAVILQPPITRCLTNLTFYANYRVAGTPAYQLADGTYGSTITYHIFNMMLHATNGILLFSLLQTLLAGPRSRSSGGRATANRRAQLQGKTLEPVLPPTQDPLASIATWVALGATLVWLVHPVQTMAVTYISQRYAMCGAMAFLGTLLCYAKLRRRMESGTAWSEANTIGSHVLVVALPVIYLTCFATKENAAMAAWVALAMELVFFRGTSERGPVPFWLDIFPSEVRSLTPSFGLLTMFFTFLIIATAKFGYEFYLPGSCPTFPNRETYFQTEWVVLLQYFKLYVWPMTLSMEQAFPGITWTEAEAHDFHMEAHPDALLLALGAHTLILMLAIKWWFSGRRFLTFAVAWYYLTLAPESSIVPILDPMVDHRLYLPSACLAAGGAYAIARAALFFYELKRDWTAESLPRLLGAFERGKRGWELGLGAGLALLALTALTQMWPLVAIEALILAFALSENAARWIESIKVALYQNRQEIGVWILGGWACLVGALGFGTFLRNRVYTPIGIWTDAIAKRPDCARAYSSLGMEYLYQQDWFHAIEPIEAALYLGPYHVEGWNDIGKAYLEIGTNLPNNGHAVYPCPPLEWARDALMRGIDVNEVAPSPSVPLCWNNLGLTYMRMSERILGKDAKADAERAKMERLAAGALAKACEIDQGYETAWINLGTCLTKSAERATGGDKKDLARKAIQAFANSHATTPQHQLFPICARNLALAYRALGHHASAFYVLTLLASVEEATLRETILLGDEAAAAAEEVKTIDAEIDILKAQAVASPKNEIVKMDLEELEQEKAAVGAVKEDVYKVGERLEITATSLTGKEKGEHLLASRLFHDAARIAAAKGDTTHALHCYDRAISVSVGLEKAQLEKEKLELSNGTREPVGPH